MSLKDLVPWTRRDRREISRRGEDPFFALQREMNRLFDDFLGGFASPAERETALGTIWPSVDVSETDKEVQLTAELPGMEEKDIDVTLSDDTLTIRGEKKFEKESEGKEYYRMERSYGSFHRTIPLPAEVDSEKADATFKNGVLTIVLPKIETPESRKKISVRRTG